VRVTTAFNRVLRVPGAWVRSVEFTEAGIVVGLGRRGPILRCPCGYASRSRYDRSRRRWRHLDMGACQVWLEADICRLACPQCGIRTEDVPWARPRARHTRDFEDVVAWLVQRTDKTSVATLMRCSWEAVHAIVGRVVADHLDESRLDGLYHLGVDEISYKRGHQYLTIVADHDRGGVVWVAKGHRGLALESFFDALGPERSAQLRAMSMDLGWTYQDVTRRRAPKAAICFDPFHVIRMANRALDAVYGEHRGSGTITAREWRAARYALRTGAERLNRNQRSILNQIRRGRYRLWRAWELKEALRDLYRTVHPRHARSYLQRWCDSAARSRIDSFVLLARQIRHHLDGIVRAVKLGFSNSRLEGINSKIRLINRRGYGHHTVASLAEMIYLCLGGITLTLPTQT
jgi:transposase